MPKRHLKRLNMPRTWEIKRKVSTFITRPHPGAHKLEHGMPLGIVIKELLGLAKTTKEVKDILNNKELLVDGKRRKDQKSLVGLMDIITIPQLKKSYRMILDNRGKLKTIEIADNEVNLKLCKVMSKTLLRGKKIQLNLGSNRNIIIEKDEYTVGDTVVIGLPDQKINKVLKLEKGASIYLIGGKHLGSTGSIENIEGNMITFRTPEKEVYQTFKKFLFVVGKDKPEIALSKQAKTTKETTEKKSSSKKSEDKKSEEKKTQEKKE
ncbi:30S ribosomal protein S4e [Nanoarchaeota archaeon]